MIREFRAADLEETCRIEKELFTEDAWDSDAFRNEVSLNPFAFLYVYELNHRVIGYVDLWIGYENAEIANIAVSSSYQHQHIGSALMDYCIQKSMQNNCANMSLEVRMSNQNAIALYEKKGFTKAAKRRHYYSDGEDAWLMVKELGGSAYDNAAGN